MNRNSQILIVAAVVVGVIISIVLVHLESPQLVSPVSNPALNGTTIITETSPVSTGTMTLTATPTASLTQGPSQTAVSGTNNPIISQDQAEQISLKTFAQLNPDRVNITYIPRDKSHRATYAFELFKDNENIVQGGVDPDTGSINDYAIGIKRLGRPENPVVSLDAAQKTAGQEIADRNGVLSLNRTDARYDPLGMPDSGVAGTYVFVYERLTKSNPCDCDGFTVVVDSVSGSVAEYRKTWIKPPEEIC
jgi:hypothetical protein